MSNWWRCRCCRDCSIFSDDFVDDPSTTLNPDWTEESGDWEYVGDDFLQENGNVDASVLAVATTRTSDQSVSCVLRDLQTGDKPRLICNAVDELNYFFAEMEQNATDTTVRICKRTGGSNTLLISKIVDQIDPNSDVTICVNKTSLAWYADPVPGADAFVYACNPSLFPSGKKSGLGNGGTSTIQFDDFAVGDFIGVDGRRCCVQQCLCKKDGEEFCIPHNLIITLTAWGSCYTKLDGVTIPIVYQPENDWWESATPAPWCMSTATWILSCGAPMQCPQTPAPNFTLRTISGDLCTEICDGEISYSCDPLVAAFPCQDHTPFDPSVLCECCDDQANGGWCATVTEAP